MEAIRFINQLEVEGRNAVRRRKVNHVHEQILRDPRERQSFNCHLIAVRFVVDLFEVSAAVHSGERMGSMTFEKSPEEEQIGTVAL